MPNQQISLTVLPGGVVATGTALRLSVHVSPRLSSDGVLADFPDWLDWPATLSGLKFSLELLGQQVECTVDSTADSARWTAMFPGSTPVRGYTESQFTNRRYRSYPVRDVLTFVRDRYGRFGTLYPEQLPPYGDLAAPDAFGPVGFEERDARTHVDDPEHGWHRRAALAADLEGQLTPVPGDPATWAISSAPAAASDGDALAKALLMVERFHRRPSPPDVDRAPLAEPEPDFHEIVSMSRDHYHLQRLLGLVLDLTCPAADLLAQLGGVPTPAVVSLAVGPEWQPDPGGTLVRHRTHCLVGAGGFRAAAQQPGELSFGLLRLGDPARFVVVPVDPDGAALKARAFADTVTRSRVRAGTPGNESRATRSSATPSRYPLPALRTGGLSVARVNRAAEVAKKVARATDQSNTGAAGADLYTEDLVRGYRWDVHDGQTWRSLMWRAGTYTFDGGGPVPVVEEGVARLAATGSGDPADTDLYLGESLLHWQGWSLAVAPPGAPAPDDYPVPSQPVPVVRFAVTYAMPTDPDRLLPRLRFARTYRFRARAVDLAGNDLTRAEADPGDDPVLRTADQAYRRFEPVPPPDFYLADTRTPGEAVDLAVVCTEPPVASPHPGGPPRPASRRHLAPPRMSVRMAERHGLLDGAGPGQPMDTGLRDRLATGDAAAIGVLPEPGHPDTGYMPDPLPDPLPYLPEYLSRRALLRGLPGTAETMVAFRDTGALWHHAQAFQVLLRPGPAGWDLDGAGRVLTVRLDPADMYRVTVSSQFDQADLPALGLWPWISAWAAAHYANPLTLSVKLAAIKKSIVGGRAWLFTPPRDLVLVHAVRAPLRPPEFHDVSVGRTGQLGATDAVFRGALLVCRKSSGTVDVIGRWLMPVDTGDNPDPDIPHEFRGTAFTLTLDRPYGPMPAAVEPVTVTDRRHELGDTKYRSITYDAVAVSRFVEHFRQTATLDFDAGPAQVAAPVVPPTVVVTRADGVVCRPARSDETDPATASGDYVVTDAVAGIVAPTPAGQLAGQSNVRVSYVRPPIHLATTSTVYSLPSTARPAAPKVRYLVPTFGWEPGRGTTSRRRGGGLRVWLDRPWWSSGDGERLGVLLWPSIETVPPEEARPYVTMWGHDPVSAPVPSLPAMPGHAFFTRRVAGLDVSGALTIPNRDRLADGQPLTVGVAAHDVRFHKGRNLWYCDIEVRWPALGQPELGPYFPFVRLALARFQPTSLPGTHLSAAVTADFMQLAPDRTLTVVAGAPTSRTVILEGRTRGGGLLAHNLVWVTVERQVAGIDDDPLRWTPAGQPHAVRLAPAVLAGNNVRWQGTVTVPTGVGPVRLLVEEFEYHATGAPTETTEHFDLPPHLWTTPMRLVHFDTTPPFTAD